MEKEQVLVLVLAQRKYSSKPMILMPSTCSSLPQFPQIGQLYPGPSAAQQSPSALWLPFVRESKRKLSLLTRLSDQEENCSVPNDLWKAWDGLDFGGDAPSTLVNTESSQRLLKHTKNKNTHTLRDYAPKPRDFRLLILFGYYFLGKVVSTCAVKPASKNLAIILFPLVMYKNLWKDSGNLFYGSKLLS